MKKKQLTYLLLLLVVGIWGYIFFKFFNDAQKPSSQYQVRDIVPLTLETDSTEYSFALLGNYRDPFLGSYASTFKKRTRITKPKTLVTTIVTFPKIIYQGIVANNTSKKKIGTLMIDDQNYMVQIHEKIGEMEIIGIYKDSISVKIGKSHKTFRK